ncbi:hypothetical protein N7499_003621 [Penicillium canescens]|uniref:Uncharacterized protein n=1 Tax=Penicillium canescens TaxID=5083 RepID=A0AAD6IA23_PENCN|nr:hypothetical protein N7522_000425 [Penicillium canescens]KAJ6038757.1 hypothetical protein N7460_007474 [Penicillium canescens]KAJ6090907.1 hypothetical protein N7499_003621 [Penicillium canescens]
MEVDDPPAADPRPGTPHLFESSEPPSDPATPTPFPRSSLKPTPVPGQEAWQTTAPNQRDRTRQRQRQTKESDSRIFLRLPSSSSLRDIGPHGVRVTLACKVPGEITRVQTVPTGYAISATNEGTTFLLSSQAKQLAGDGYFEAATEYHQVVVSRIPQRIWTPDNGWMPTTVSDISVEAERITGQKPLTTKLSNHRIEADSVTAVIAFPKKLRYALQLFGASGLSRPTRPKQRPLQCTRCHSFHDTRACRSSERCVSCGSSKPEHTCRAQCINCHGPHAADYPKCPARPYTQKGAIVRLSKAALTAVRKAGRTAFQQQQARRTPDPRATNPGLHYQPSSQLSQELANQLSPNAEL